MTARPRVASWLRLLALALFALLAARPLAAAPAGSELAGLARDVEREESLRAIKTLQRSYAQYAQYGLWNEIGALFAPDARFTFDGLVLRGQTMDGPAEIAEFLRTRYGGGHEGLEAGDTRLMLVDAPLILLASNGREATGRWTVLNFIGGRGKAAIEGGILIADYRLSGGKWRIAGARFFPQYAGSYETGWTNWGGGDLPIVPYHFTPDDAGTPILAPEGPAPATETTSDELSLRIRDLNDEDTVRNLQAALGYYVDRKMWDDVVDMFAADDAGVQVDREDGRRATWLGKDGVRRWLEGTMGPPGLKHGQLNDWPQFDVTVTVMPGGEAAFVRGIELGMLGDADVEKGAWEGAVFFNRFVKQDGVWKLATISRTPLFKADYDLGWGASSLPEERPTGVNAPDDVAPPLRPAHRPEFFPRHPVTGEPIGDRGNALANEAVDAATYYEPAPTAAAPSVSELSRRLSRSVAWDAVENVSSAYTAYLDDLQSDKFGGLLAKDGFKMSAFAGYYVGRDRVTEAGVRVWGPPPTTRAGVHFHWRPQPVILVSDDGRSANMRVRLFQPRTGKEVGGPGGWYGAYFYTGMYHDQFVLEDGVWRMWNLSLDEPYISNVAWKTGWARAKDPVAAPQGATSVLVREDSEFKPDVPVTALGARQLHFRGGTGEPWQWPTILPMWFEYRNPVSGRMPEHFQADCPPCTVRPDLRLDHHGYQQPPTWPQVPQPNQ